jgi:hypothetical protein
VKTKPEINDGGPAFPVLETDEHRQPYHTHPGMSLRAWLAGMVMQGMASVDSYNFREDAVSRECAIEATHMADALIAELEKEAQ